MGDKTDNTPYWAVDPCRWDIYRLDFTGTSGSVYFDVSKEETVQHLLSAIQQRHNRLFIGFTHYDHAKEKDFEYDVIQLAQFGKNICHACVWFGEHVCTLAAGSDVGLQMTGSPLNYGRWELVSLPFTDVPLAFRIGVDIVLKCNEGGIKYKPQTWQVLWHVMTRLFVPGSGEDSGNSPDYNPDRPETWTKGVQCSQLVLLFLKRCILHNALHIPPRHRERFLRVHSFTCLPARLRVLLAEVWGGVGEFRDYRGVGEEVRKRWYPHYCARRETALFK
jgi:hypothetical protein